MKPDPQKLRLAREKHGTDRPTLAAAVSVSERTIYSWENGSVRPSTLQVGALAAFLGCAVADLCSDDVAPRRKPSPLREVPFVVTCRQCAREHTLTCKTIHVRRTEAGMTRALRAAGWKGSVLWTCPACVTELCNAPCKCKGSGVVAGMEGEALDCQLCEVANG